VKRHLAHLPLLLVLVLAAQTASADRKPGAPEVEMPIAWQKDVRAALEVAEDRGIPLLLYITRDD
jgi:hypothetical protein